MKRFVALCAGLSFLAAAAAVPAPASPSAVPDKTAPAATPVAVFSGSVAVTSVEIVVRATDREGRPVSDLRPRDLEVLEDGKPVRVTDLTPFIIPAPAKAAPAPTAVPTAVPTPSPVPTPARPAAAAPRVTIYIQNELLEPGQMAWAISGLEENAGRIVAMGPVRVVVADPDPVVVADGVTDPARLVRVLDRVRREHPARNRIGRLRREFYREIRGVTANMVKHLAIVEARHEEAVVRRVIERLEAWAAGKQRHGGRVLLLVSGGFDLEPYDYYTSFVTWADQGDLRRRFEGGTEQDVGQRIAVAELWQRLSQELAGLGWTVVGFTGGLGETSSTAAAETSGTTRAQGFLSAVPQGMTANAGTLLLHPVDPLREAADASGGAVSVTPKALGEALTGLQRAYVLAYTVPRPADGKVHHVTVRARRAGVVVHAPGVVRAVVPRGDNERRARLLLFGGRAAGEFPVTARITGVSGSRRKGYSGRLVVRAQLGKVLGLLLAAGQPRMVVALAVDRGTSEPFITRGEPMPLRLLNRRGDWEYETTLHWPAKAKALAVVVGELTTDTWGGTRIELAH